MASTNNLVNPQVPRLLKDNYASWSIQMRALFGSQELWEIIVDRFTEPTPEEEAAYTADEKKVLMEQRKKDNKAHFLLYQGLDEFTFEGVCRSKNKQGGVRHSFHYLQSSRVGEPNSSPNTEGRS